MIELLFGGRLMCGRVCLTQKLSTKVGLLTFRAKAEPAFLPLPTDVYYRKSNSRLEWGAVEF